MPLCYSRCLIRILWRPHVSCSGSVFHTPDYRLLWCFDTCSHEEWSDIEQHAQAVNEPSAAPPKQQQDLRKATKLCTTRLAQILRKLLGHHAAGPRAENRRGASLLANRLQVEFKHVAKLLKTSCFSSFRLLNQSYTFVEGRLCVLGIQIQD